MTTEVTPPNIFKFATSELSQDAVLAYILSWAHPDYHKDHPKLNKLGKELLDALLNKARNEIKTTEITKLDVGTQDNRMDVYVKINDSVFLIIEDKTETKEHSGQIDRYRGIAESLKTEDGEDWQILAVYVKTGNESAASHPEDVGCFLRGDLLAVLKNNPDTDNDIIEEFRSHLQKWEKDTNSFKTTPFKSWSWKAHEGYYLALEAGLNEKVGADWSYVSNPAGGALVFWWCPEGDYNLENSKCEFYLTIDQYKGLFIRVGERKDDDGNPIKVGVDFLWEVLEKAKQEHAKNSGGGMMQVEKPSRYRSGWTANAAQIYFGTGKDNQGRPYIATNQNEMIDLDATIERLEKATKLVGCLYCKD